MKGFKAAYLTQRESHLKLINFMGFNTDSFKIDGLSFSDYEEKWLESVEYMSKLKLIDAEYFLHESLAKGRRVLAEGAQGTMLDVDFGSYPYVTSSSTSIGGVCTGLGVNPGNIGEVIGVFKAYCTRVGSGPFPTEQLNGDGEKMRAQGHEFGSTTGRPRRCGWLDMVALKYAIMINGVTRLFMMKTDVLNDFERIQVATGYKAGNKEFDQVPYDFAQDDLGTVNKDLPGWNTSLSEIRQKDQMPLALKDYVSFIEKRTGVPLIGLSYGPDRKETLIF
jgi:adenylosuccinate synthase